MSTEKEQEKKSVYGRMMDRCPILFTQRHWPMTQTCMCWGVDCGEGWSGPLMELCTELEMLNLTEGKRIGFEIQAQQIKQKYGTLRFYYTVRQIVPWWRRIISAPFKWLSLGNPEATGIERRVGDMIAHSCYAISSRIQYGSWDKQDRMLVIIEAIDNYVEKRVRECEEACYNVCEDCGRSFMYNPRCETLGWISYICPECAKKNKVHYVYNLTDKEKAYFERCNSEECKRILENVGKELDSDGNPVEERK